MKKKKHLDHEELLEHLDWLARELKHPADITVHTEKAKEDLGNVIYTSLILAIASQQGGFKK